MTFGHYGCCTTSGCVHSKGTRRDQETFGSHVTTTKKKAREKAGHAQNLLPIRTAFGHVTVTSDQKAPLGRICRNFLLCMRRTYFRTWSLPVTWLMSLPITWQTSLPVTWLPVAPPQMWLCPCPYTTYRLLKTTKETQTIISTKQAVQYLNICVTLMFQVSLKKSFLLFVIIPVWTYNNCTTPSRKLLNCFSNKSTHFDVNNDIQMYLHHINLILWHFII